MWKEVLMVTILYVCYGLLFLQFTVPPTPAPTPAPTNPLYPLK